MHAQMPVPVEALRSLETRASGLRLYARAPAVASLKAFIHALVRGRLSQRRASSH